MIEHMCNWDIELDHGTSWFTQYDVELHGTINLGCRQTWEQPGEPTHVEDFWIIVSDVTDFRFGDSGCPVDLVKGEVDESDAGKWLLAQLSKEEVERLKQILLEDWSKWELDRKYKGE